MAKALVCLPSSAIQPLAEKNAVSAIWATAGGPIDEISNLLGALSMLGLIAAQEQHIKRTRAGDAVVRDLKRKDYRSLGLTMIRAGIFHDQARLLVETGTIGDDGCLSCSLKAAKVCAPQLVFVLEWWETVSFRPDLLIPSAIARELNTVWALLPPPVSIPEWATERKKVGDRAEMYSVQFEKLRSSQPSKIIWVARDSDSLGWDIEDRSETQMRCIEVKGRRNSDVIFFLSENEMSKARLLGVNYEIHFWGEIDLNRDPSVEFNALLAAGYPLVLSDVEQLMSGQDWKIEPIQWRFLREHP